MDEAAKKAVLRLFTYGLYVVTCQHGHRRNAFTANWVTQVSFEPPLVALSVENQAVSLGIIRGAGQFTLCVLESGTRAMAGTLGRSLRDSPTKLEGVAWRESSPGATDNAPAIAECLGWLHCTLHSEAAAGDSTLLIGQVVEATLLKAGQPLTMREAGFRHSG